MNSPRSSIEHTEQNAKESLLTLRGALDASLQSDVRPKIILTDLDHTICYDYIPDQDTGTHRPIIHPEVIAALRNQTAVVASGRRANHPYLRDLWLSGLLSADTPFVTEDGGSLVWWRDDGTLRYTDLISEDQAKDVKETALTAVEHLEMPRAARIEVKIGRTCVVARLHDSNGEIAGPAQQQTLAEQLQWLTGEHIGVVSTRASVMIQHTTVNKAAAFRFYLDSRGIDRTDVCVVGLGDAPNDRQIFEESDIAIAFSDEVAPLAHFVADASSVSAAAILKQISGRQGEYR